MAWVKAVGNFLLGVFAVVFICSAVVLIASDYKDNAVELDKLKRTQEVCPRCGGTGIVHKNKEPTK